jgi:hypothetical protein
MYPLCCPLPLCIHGNSCLLGSTTGNLQCLNRLGSDQHHCGKHTSISVICWPMRAGIQFRLYPVCTGLKFLMQGLHPFWLLLAESWYSVVVLIFLSVTMYILTVFDYYLYGIWIHIDTSQLNNVLYFNRLLCFLLNILWVLLSKLSHNNTVYSFLYHPCVV